MKVIVALLALVAVVYSQNDAICNGGVYMTETSSYYNLGQIALPYGEYYTHTDGQTGITYYWNTCNQVQDMCGDNAAACYSIQSGDFNAQAYFKAGAYDSFFTEVITDDDDERVEVSFFGGELCADLNQNRAISFVYHCDPLAYQPNVTMVDNSQDCSVAIHVNTSAACGVYSQTLDGDMPYYHHFHNMHKIIMIGVWIFVALSACICCCACCAIIRRRRCQNRTGGWCRRTCNKKGAVYTELATKVETPVAQPQIQPTAPVQQPALAPPQYYPVQYIPAQQYYMMQQQFMAQQQQQFLQQQQQPAPVVELEAVNTDPQVDADEQLARQLQAQFNAEH
jgi:hypothetical protein